MKKTTAPITYHNIFPGGYVRLRFLAPEIARAARPGQFINILTCSDFIPYLRRPIGVEDVLEETGEVSALVKIVGPGTKNLAERAVGDRMDLIGPLGNGFDLGGLRRTLYLVAGGAGIAPFLHLARVMHKTRPDVRVVLFYGGRTATDLVSLPDFGALVSRVVTSTEDGSLGFKGFVTVPLEEELSKADPADSSLFACGPLGMMKAASDLAARSGIACSVSLETVMGCGIGSCLGCVVQVRDKKADYGPGVKGTGEFSYVRVCTEGPVFDAASLTWEGLV
jgi:dihydroorotate dehydrogenase electron transfer subunit